MSDKVYTQTPPPPTTLAQDPQAQLSEQAQEQYQQVLNHFSQDTYSIPAIENDAQLSEEEKFWLSRECLLRYLRASKWKTQTAIKRLELTLKWRREYGLYDLVTAKHVEPEAVTGKEIVYGYDIEGRPALYMFPSRQNTDEPTRQIQFAVWMLERCVDLMRPGVETMTLLINYADKAKSPAISTARAVLNILQEHYPERLGKSLIIKIPFLVNAFFKIILPFVDPITREKIKFNPDVVKDGYFTPEMLMTGSWEGAADFEYDHDKYWSALISLCEERKKVWLQKWRSLGGTVGIKEWDYKQEDGAEKVIELVLPVPQVKVELVEPGDAEIGVAVSSDEQKGSDDDKQNGHANGHALESVAEVPEAT
ncbi:CRAL/TRIO domain containing protein [Amanita muscaria]